MEQEKQPQRRKSLTAYSPMDIPSSQQQETHFGLEQFNNSNRIAKTSVFAAYLVNEAEMLQPLLEMRLNLRKPKTSTSFLSILRGACRTKPIL